MENKEPTDFEKNRIIAQFMGAKDMNGRMHIEGVKSALLTKYYPRQLKYQKSWDWIMPVVRKIASLLINKDWENINHAVARWKPITNEIENGNLVNVHYCIHKFIVWYNSQSK